MLKFFYLYNVTFFSMAYKTFAIQEPKSFYCKYKVIEPLGFKVVYNQLFTVNL